MNIMIKKHFILSFFLISILVLAFAPKASAYTSTDRIAGYDRYQTAVAASQNGWPDGATSAILAYGENFPDALSAGPLANLYNAPILLTGSYALNNDTATELKRLKVKKVYIIGGTGVISKNIDNQLSSMSIASERLAGHDRYETSLIVAQKIGLSKGVFAAIGTSFQDALSIGPIAAAKGMPLLLVPPNDLTLNQKIVLGKTLIPASYILTGSSDLSNKVIHQFPNYEVIYGADPYERNTNFITRFADSLDLDRIYVATGEIFPDALAASALAQKNKHPILLLKGDAIPNSTRGFMSSSIISELNILGGYGVISAFTESTLATLTPRITSVADTLDSVQEQGKYEPPKTVTVTTTNGLQAQAPVTWSLVAVYSLRAGIYEFEGTIKNYSGRVLLRLTVTPIWNKLTGETVRNGHFTFPSTLEVPMGDNTRKSYPVIWNLNLANLSNIGTHAFQGTVPDLNEKVTLTLKISEDSEVKFTDLALKTVVCRTLGKPADATLYKSDILNISMLFAYDSGISDLTGLEHFTNLKTLYLGKNPLTRITPLTDLVNLRHLELRDCGLSDLNALRGLTSLTYLDIASNNIKDLSPLRQLTNLSSLYLRDNSISDYSPVRSYYKNLSGRDFHL